MTGKRKKAAPKKCEECGNWHEIRQRVRISKLLQSAITSIETKLTSQELKPSMSDYLKLLQLERELEEETPKEVKVTWVEPTAESNSGE